MYQKRLLILLTLAGAALFFSGCESSSQDESNLPWSRPASWEGTAPGMGAGASPGRDRY